MATREQGERLRAMLYLQQLRDMTSSVDIALANDRVPPGWDVAHALVATAVNLATAIARLDAYHRAADDAASQKETPR
jgi:hypothetical protein